MPIIPSSGTRAPMQAPTFAPDAPRPLFRMLAVAAGGLSAQRARMEVAAQNIANADTTRSAEGGAYRRKSVVLESAPTAMDPTAQHRGAFVPMGGRSDVAGSAARAMMLDILSAEPTDAGGVRVAGITDDTTEGALVYDPGHPDADAQGYVRMPNVRTTDEMMDLMDARRVYDANATVFQAAKSMLRRALDL